MEKFDNPALFYYILRPYDMNKRNFENEDFDRYRHGTYYINIIYCCEINGIGRDYRDQKGRHTIFYFTIHFKIMNYVIMYYKLNQCLTK